MRVVLVVFWATAERVLALKTGSANEGGVRFNADPEEPVAEDDPDNVEMRGWMSPEGIAAAEREAAERQEALAMDLQAAERLLFSLDRRADTGPMEISAVCEQFGLSVSTCAERVERYLGRLGRNATRVTLKVGSYFSGLIVPDTLMAIGLGDMCKIRASYAGQVYRADFCKILDAASKSAASSLKDQHALFKFGDRRDKSACYPTFYKTRLISRRDDNYVLMDWNRARHWGAVSEVSRADIPFHSKMPRVVWRGVSTGKCNVNSVNSRMMLCKKWFHTNSSLIDVGFNSIVQGCSAGSHYVKPPMSMQSQLRAKYILVVNGNDKASGLNWALASNSVPFMVEPDIESWLLESSLQAWEHYVPIRPDFSDLMQQLDWAKKNDNEAQRIAMAGKEFMKQFGSAARETSIEAAVLTAYLDRMKITTGGANGKLEGSCSKS
jgi:hypothetical protein